MSGYARITLAVLVVFSLLPGGQSAATAVAAHAWGPLEILGRTIAPGESRRFKFMKSPRFEGAYIDIPVFVARGTLPGATLCVTAGIHGDEINGFEIARRVFDARIIGMSIPQVALSGFILFDLVELGGATP